MSNFKELSYCYFHTLTNPNQMHNLIYITRKETRSNKYINNIFTLKLTFCSL